MKIYAGLTLQADAVRARAPGAAVAPPIRRGDLRRDIADGVDAVGIIDGVFNQSAAVTPAELLEALRAGISVWGASSMGALRAAELAPFGVRGVGRIYQLVAGSPGFRDDFVAQAVIERDGRLEAASGAWVDLHFRLHDAVAAGEVEPTVARELTELYAGIDYPLRTSRALLARCTSEAQRAAAALAFAPGPTQKALDAHALLEAMLEERARCARALRPRPRRVVDPAAYLRDFHAHRPGATARSLGRGRLPDGRPSYALAAEVDAESVLDLGCGDGLLLAALDDGARALFGLDPSPEELARARARAPRATLLEAEAGAIPLPDGAVGAVVSHMALMLAKPLDVAVRELARVLRPGGQVALVVPDARPPEGFLLDLGAEVRTRLAAARVELALGEPAATPQGIAASLHAHGLVEVSVAAHTLVMDAELEVLLATIDDLYGADLLAAADRARVIEGLRSRYPGDGRVPCRAGVACVTARKP